MVRRNDISAWLKPTAAARRLGISQGRARDLANSGELITATDFHGALRFDPYTVEQLRRRLEAGGKQVARAQGALRAGDGKAHAKAFRMFAEDRPLRDIVIECELTAQAVLDLKRNYAELGRDFLISAPGLAELRDVLDWRTEATERNLLAAIRRKLHDSFERGQRVTAEPDKHTIEESASGNTDGGAEGGDRSPDDEIAPLLRGDREGRAAG